MQPQETQPQEDGVALFSSEHPDGPLRDLLLDDRTIGEIMMDKEKNSFLFTFLRLIKK